MALVVRHVPTYDTDGHLKCAPQLCKRYVIPGSSHDYPIESGRCSEGYGADCTHCVEWAVLCFTPYQAIRIYKELKEEEREHQMRIPWNYTDDGKNGWRDRWESEGSVVFGDRYPTRAGPMTTTEKVCEVAKRTATACLIGSTYACIPIPCCTPCVWVGCNVDFRADPCCLHADYYRECEGVPWEEYRCERGGMSTEHGDDDSRSRGQSAERQPLLDHRSSATREQPRKGGGMRVPPLSGTSRLRADEEPLVVRQQPKRNEETVTTVRGRRTHLSQDERSGAIPHSLDEPEGHRRLHQRLFAPSGTRDHRLEKVVSGLAQSLVFKEDMKRILGNEYRKAALLISSKGEIAVRTAGGNTRPLYAKVEDIEDDAFRRCCKAVVDLAIEYSSDTEPIVGVASIPLRWLWKGKTLSESVSRHNGQQSVSDPSVVREQPRRGGEARVPPVGKISAEVS
ncbi:MAG: hypothetical protein OXF02_00395 [Simkaniaceae bacterium]|nr:hypothetical protein [Simkaniaceae bacterium]